MIGKKQLWQYTLIGLRAEKRRVEERIAYWEAHPDAPPALRVGPFKVSGFVREPTSSQSEVGRLVATVKGLDGWIVKKRA